MLQKVTASLEGGRFIGIPSYLASIFERRSVLGRGKEDYSERTPTFPSEMKDDNDLNLHMISGGGYYLRRTLLFGARVMFGSL